MNKSILISTFIATSLSWVSLTQATDSGSRYQTWQPPAGEQVHSQKYDTAENEKYQRMINRLNTLIDDAETARAADRRFIHDLREVLQEYDWPWHVTLLDEDFTDGNVSKSPAWVMESGDFKVRRGYGLHSKVRARTDEPESKQSDKELAVAILGAILKEAAKSNDNGNNSNNIYDPATILVNNDISNDFAINVTLDIQSTQAKVGFGVFQKTVSGPSYELIFTPGTQASIELRRSSGNRSSIIAVSENIGTNNGQAHQIQWTRDSRGNMSVMLNGKTAIQTADRSLKDPFTGFNITNYDGEIYIRSVKVSGT